MSENVNDKELVVVKEQVSKLVTSANGLTIKTGEDLAKASDALALVKTVGKEIKDRKEAITKPLMEALNSARDLFKPFEQDQADAERTIKMKVLVFQQEQTKARNEAMAKIEKKVENGTMKTTTAIKKMEAVAEVPKAASGTFGKIATRTIKKVRIAPLLDLKLDLAGFQNLLQNGFIIWNEAAVKSAALKGATIPGVEVYEEQSISSSMK